MKLTSLAVCFILLLCLIPVGIAQQTTTAIDGPPPNAIVSVYGYDGTGNLKYLCQAPQNAPASTWSVGGGTLTQIVVAAGTATITFAAAPGIYAGALVTITGAGALNGSYPITGTSGATATFASSATGTYNASGVTVVSSNPLLGANYWAIHEFVYNGSNQLVASYWAAGVTTQYSLACSNAGSY